MSDHYPNITCDNMMKMIFEYDVFIPLNLLSFYRKEMHQVLSPRWRKSCARHHLPWQCLRVCGRYVVSEIYSISSMESVLFGPQSNFGAFNLRSPQKNKFFFSSSFGLLEKKLVFSRRPSVKAPKLYSVPKRTDSILL